MAGGTEVAAAADAFRTALATRPWRRGLDRAVLIVAGVVAVGACNPAPTPAQLDEIRDLFSAAGSSYPQIDAAFAEAVRKRPAPSGDAPCTAAFRVDDRVQFAKGFVWWVATRHGSGVIVDREPRVLQASNVTVVPAEAQVSSLGSAAVAARRAKQDALLGREEPYAELGGKQLVAAARKLAQTPLPTELLIVIAATREAVPIDSKTFTGGAAMAQAWLFSAVDRRFVCAGTVLATSSDRVEVWRHPQGDDKDDDKGSVNLDLLQNLLKEAEKSLRGTK